MELSGFCQSSDRFCVIQGSTLVAASVFALFLQQCAFVGHDSAHNGITHHRNVDIMIGMVSAGVQSVRV